MDHSRQLISYIALSAPATRRPSTGEEAFLRPEIGFTPKWYNRNVGVHLGERWHQDPAYRRQAIPAMATAVRSRFQTDKIGPLQDPEKPVDLLTGTFGTSFVAAVYGVPIAYQADSWPWSKPHYLSDDQADCLEPPDLDSNRFFSRFMEQLDWIASENGSIEGYVNWQGVLNNCYRLRGETLFIDMVVAPERAMRIFDSVTATMIDGARRVYERQKASGVERHHFTVSNCLVNMVSPDQYERFLLPCDQRIAETFGLIGVHNCAWNASPYFRFYSRIPFVGYIDMGIESDLDCARDAFPSARRALMYRPTALADKSSDELRQDLEKTAREYGPCDVVVADIEAGTPDERIRELIALCEKISEEKGRSARQL